MNIKRLYNKAPQPYKEFSKSDIRHGQRPYKKDSKIVQQKDNIKFNNKDNYNNITTTTNITIAVTPINTKLDYNLEDYKSNHNKRCPK